MRAWQGAQGYCEAAVAQVQHCREALFLILRWGPGPSGSSFEFCASNGDLGETRRAAGHLGGSVVVHTGPFGIRAPPTRPSKHNFDAQTIFREETDRGNGIATSKTSSLPKLAGIARADCEH